VQHWQKVRSNYKEVSLSRLREMLSSRSLTQEQDAILVHLEQFVEQTFNLAQPNLRVNGQNFESLDENGREMELFDETLDRRIWSLADTRLQWQKRIAETRRTVPAETESTIKTLLEHHREVDMASLHPLSEEPREETDMEAEFDRQRRIEQTLQKTSALTNELDQTTLQQRERGDRVKAVALEVKSLKP